MQDRGDRLADSTQARIVQPGQDTKGCPDTQEDLKFLGFICVTEIMDSGSGILDRAPVIQDAGSWIQNLGSRIQDLASRIQHLGSNVQELVSRVLDPGFKVLCPQSWILLYRIPGLILTYCR